MLAARFSILYYFYSYLRRHLLLLFSVNFLSGCFDAIGIAMFIPLIQIADNPSAEAAPDNALTRAVYSFFHFTGIPISIPTMLALIVFFFVAKAIFTYYAQVYQSITIQSFIRNIRRKNAIGLKNLSYREFISCDVGRLQNSMTGEANIVAMAVDSYITSLNHGLLVAVYMGIAFVIDWSFSIFIFVGGLLTNILYRSFYGKIKELSRKINWGGHDYAGLVVQSVSHFKYLKATGRNEDFTSRQLNVLDKIISNTIKVRKISAVLNSMREPMMIVIVCIVIGIYLMLMHSPLTAIIAILALFYRALTYIIALQQEWSNFLSGSGSLENMMSFEKYLADHRDILVGEKPIGDIQTIDLKNVTVRYDTVDALRNVSMTIRRLDNIAIVGESGSGKTTLTNVICGLIHPDIGELFINNTPIENADINNFKSQIGYITQDPTVFNADIFDNITFWDERTEANLDKFNRIIDLCRLRDFIDSLPKGHSEMLGNNGLNLSGGQKQRVSIARELYRDVELLLMDEATSALDAETEKEIRDNLEMLQGKLTVITIAHRLSTIRNADKIYLLRKGEIEAAGTFEELKQKSEYFKKSAELQGL
jgi:subfamily B ATP-binding cassette protein MsbA